MSDYQIITDERLAEIFGAMTTALRGPSGSNSHLWPKFEEVRLLVGGLATARAELADLRAYKERTEAGLVDLSGAVTLNNRTPDDGSHHAFLLNTITWKMRRNGLWRDPPQAEVQP